MSILLRAARSSELAVICDSWARGFGPRPRRGPLGDAYLTVGVPRLDTKIAPNLWWAAHRGVIVGILEAATVIVAVHRDHPTAVLGWIAFDPIGDTPTLTLHFVWVRRGARRRGLGRQLLGAALGTVPEGIDPRLRLTHSTPDGEQLLRAARLL